MASRSGASRSRLLALAGLAAVVMLLAVVSLRGPEPAEAGLAWPLDVTYQVTTIQEETTFVSVERFIGTSWRNWTNEVLDLQVNGPLAEAAGIPPGSGSTVRRSPQGSLTSKHYPGLQEGDWKPQVTKRVVDPEALVVPGPYMTPALADLDLMGELANAREIDVMSAFPDVESVAEDIGLSLEMLAAVEAAEEWTCSAEDCGTRGVHNEVTKAVYAPAANLPVLVERTQDGEVIGRMRVLSIGDRREGSALEGDRV